jgi:hypothetical protein
MKRARDRERPAAAFRSAELHFSDASTILLLEDGSFCFLLNPSQKRIGKLI